jgi:hypothetical protein
MAGENYTVINCSSGCGVEFNIVGCAGIKYGRRLPKKNLSLLKRLSSYITSFIIRILHLVISRVTAKEDKIGGT